MHESITYGCEYTSKGGLKWLAEGITALCLVLGCPSGATAQISGNSKIKITEAINPSNDVDTTKMVDFGIARKSIEVKSQVEEYKRKIEEHKHGITEIENKIDSIGNQYFNSLSEQGKIDYIYETLKKNPKVQKVLDKMLENENVNEAIKHGDNESIESEFLDSMDDKRRNNFFDGLSKGLGCIAGLFLSEFLRERKRKNKK